MVKQPFRKIQFHVASAFTDNREERDIPSQVDTSTLSLPIDPLIGTCTIYRLAMTLGMNLALVRANFTDAAMGRMVKLLQSDGELIEPSFQAVIVKNVRGVIEGVDTDFSFAIAPDMGTFRHAQRFRTKVTVDGSLSGECYVLTIGVSVLNHLIGEDVVEKLMARLGISCAPAANVKPIPQYISNLLVEAISPALVDDSRKLFAQAKSLEFLAALVTFFCTEEGARTEHDGKTRQRVLAIHDELLANKGKLPTLDEIAERHGRSAKLLNEDFANEFGESIYSFITNHRLHQAHDIILNTTTSIKVVSEELGYSHVSNFSIAFKRKFGYSPGSLRKTI